MKTNRFPLSGRLLALSLVLSAGCSKEQPGTTVVVQPKPASPSPPAPATPPEPATPVSTPVASEVPAVVTPVVETAPADPFAAMKAALDAATLEQQQGLGGIQARMDQAIDALVAAKKASADVNLAASEKLDAATQDFAEKLRMLSVARPETWATAKNHAELALQNVHAAYTEVMNSPARR